MLRGWHLLWTTTRWQSRWRQVKVRQGGGQRLRYLVVFDAGASSCFNLLKVVGVVGVAGRRRRRGWQLVFGALTPDR